MIRKHSLTIRGHRTSVSVEDPFWNALQAIAADRAMPLATLVGQVDAARDDGDNLSSAIRLFVLEWALSRGGQIPPEPVSRD